MTDTTREAVARAIRTALTDETNGVPTGCIVMKGCEAANYCDPEDAAEMFIQSVVDAALAALRPAQDAEGLLKAINSALGALYDGKHLVAVKVLKQAVEAASPPRTLEGK